MNETGDPHWVGGMGWKECGDGIKVQRMGKGRDVVLREREEQMLWSRGEKSASE